MKQALILLVSIVVVFVPADVKGTAHLSFSPNEPANVTRGGCGISKLCEETPDDCDPASDGTCLFASVSGSPAMGSNGSLYFELSDGNNTGDFFVALALAANASEGNSSVFICGRSGASGGSNGMFFFRTMQRNNVNGMLTPIEINATGIQNMTTSTRIQCVFTVPEMNVTPRPRNPDSTSVILLGSGTANGTVLGDLNIRLTTPALNLTNPTSNLSPTTAAPTTAAPALSITRTDCGNSKLCVETPDDCDPASDTTCLFTSVTAGTAMASNPPPLTFELSGAENTGDSYIGVALSASASEGTAMLYVCGRNGTTNGVNGTFFFLALERNNSNGDLTVKSGNATGIRYLLTDTKIQCEFILPRGNTIRTRTMDSTFVLQLGSGSVNGTMIGSFTPNVTTPALNLANPASNVNTTAAPTTAAPALSITRTGCGTSKLCEETPDDCDPASDTTCLFTSVTAGTAMGSNPPPLTFELSGAENTGDSYIGVALSANASEGTAMLYICGRNATTNGVNGTFFFLALERNNSNGDLTVKSGNATGIRYLLTDTKIQCEFILPRGNTVTPSPRTTDSTFVLQLGSGAVNGAMIGSFNVSLTTPALNLADPTSNVNTTATTAAPTTAGTTMSGANTALYPQVVPLLLSIFILSVLKTA